MNSVKLAQSNPLGGGFTAPSEAFSQNADTGPGAVANLESFISTTLGLLTIFGALFFTVYFVLAAFQWITAGGDQSKIQKARDRMTQGVLGLVVLVASYAILGLIGTALGLDLINVGDQILKLAPQGN